MDRFVVREPRVGAEFPQGNHPIPFRVSGPRNNANMIPENMIYGGYGMESPFFAEGYMGVQHRINNAAALSTINNSTGVDSVFLVTLYLVNQLDEYKWFPQRASNQGQILSGIDPRYLATYSDNSAAYIVTGHRIQDETPRFPLNKNFGNDYENRSIVAPDRSKTNTLKQHEAPKDIVTLSNETEQSNKSQNINIYRSNAQKQLKENSKQAYQLKHENAPTTKISMDSHSIALKDEMQVLAMTRSEKLKALHKSGPRAFSGPVEKVLKWHKSLQEVGLLIIYEIVAKCVSVRPGDSCSKNLVVRDENGPAMQVVYYEIDFLLPDLKPPCTVRVVGRMMAGTCRLQAFNVRSATGDDVATLPRRAAVAAHHITKLCKEYGMNIIN